MIAIPTPADAELAADLRRERPAASAGRLLPNAAASHRALPARRDGVKVLAGTLATFALSSAFEAQERLAAFAARFERWQVDELPLTLVALALGLAWYAWRRRGETAGLLAHNRELAQGLLDVQERERRELARELHDELAQHCTAIRVESAYLQACADPAQAAAAARRTADSASLLQQGVRRLLRRLRPAELDELGLAAAIESLAQAGAARSGVRCVVRVDLLPDDLDDALAIAVYRVVQEALSNVMQHAAASCAEVALRVDAACLVLRVADDGRGFEPARARRGLGLLGAAERAAALGGELDVDSRPGGGTRLRLVVPLRSAPLSS